MIEPLDYDPVRRRLINLAALASTAFVIGNGLNIISDDPASAASNNSNKVSYLRTAHGKTYVVANGLPYLIYGIQMRIDHIVGDGAGLVDWTLPDHYFKVAKDVGFQTVVVPVHWSYIEPAEGSYQFANYVDRVIDSANSYGLNVQILWYGADVCGFNLVPDYVRNDHMRFPRTAKFNDFFDLTSPALIKAESAALSALMTHVADYDSHHRVIMVQVENEPDGSGDLVDTVVWGDPVDKASKMFAGNQFDAAAALMNTLGNIVHRSPRSVVTRCNVGTPYRALDLFNALRKLGTGVDIVGVDTYSDDPVVTKQVLNTVPVDTPGNVAHQPEGDASAHNLICLVLSDFEEGGGFLIYDLLKLYRGDELTDPATWTGRDGTQNLKYWIDNKQYEAVELKTEVFRAFNHTVYKADKRIATTPKGSSAAFNISGNPGHWKEQRSVGNVSVTFETWDGSQAFALQDNNGDLILMNFTDGNNFILDPSFPHASSASVGYFDANNFWHEQYQRAFKGNSLLAWKQEVFRVSRSR